MFTDSARATTLPRLGLGLIIAIYILLVSLYAANMPHWNAPDEPAHFNYIRYLADRAQFPVLSIGDFDFAYLEKIKAAHFPPEMSIDPLRYESHQPPLYYLLGAAVFRATVPLDLDSRILVLRLLSGLFGLLLVLVTYSTVRRIFPTDGWLALAASALVAFTPMHLAVNAAISNDPLADLIMAVILWESVGILGPLRTPPRVGAPRARDDMLLYRLRHAAYSSYSAGLLSWPYLRLGLWLGLALLTKTTSYVGLIVAAVAILVAARQQGDLRHGIQRLAGVLAISLVISGWWFVRNALLYGISDPFGLQQQAMVAGIGGQPLTGAIGGDTLRRFAVISFQSFWGQFGWMGVLLDQRIYFSLLALSIAAALGLALYICSAWRGERPLTPLQRTALPLLVLTFILVAMAMIEYSATSFFQPQARYLFPAWVAMATGFALGIRELLAPRQATLFLTAIPVALVVLDLYSLYSYIMPSLHP